MMFFTTEGEFLEDYKQTLLQKEDFQLALENNSHENNQVIIDISLEALIPPVHKFRRPRRTVLKL